MSSEEEDPRRIAWLRLPEVLDAWRKAALTSKAARRAWVKTFGAQPEDTGRDTPCPVEESPSSRQSRQSSPPAMCAAKLSPVRLPEPDARPNIALTARPRQAGCPPGRTT
jgi:hypothetical protein